MIVDDLARQLASDYRGDGLADGKAVSVHLFGIKWANELDGVSLTELCIRAGIPETYSRELGKMKNLARYVELKK